MALTASAAEGAAAATPAGPPWPSDDAIAALRAGGAQQHDPVGFSQIEALARRAAAHGPAVRQAVEGRLLALVEDCRQRREASVARADAPGAPAPQPGPLAGLLHRLAPPAPTRPGAAELAEPPTELKATRRFRSTWARLSVDRQLARSLAQLPPSAGPLNSQLLLLRALQLMQQVSPAYLQNFMAHADALLWLADAAGGPACRPTGAMRADGDRKPERKKSAARGRAASR